MAATRQKAGSVEKWVVGADRPRSLKAPAATGFAEVIVVFANLSAARLSQDAAKAGDAASESVADIEKD